MSKVAERQRFIRHVREKTGKTEIDFHDIAREAMKMGWKAPPPVTEEDRLAKLFKDAARQDIRRSQKTGRSYKGYHAVPTRDDAGQGSFFYIDIDDLAAKPDHFRKACVMRREQTVDDLFQLRCDQMHWNESRPDDQQVDILPADAEFDIELRMADEDDKDEAA